VIAGGFAGALIVLVAIGVLTGSNLSGILAILFGAPVGGVIGGLMGARATAAKKDRVEENVLHSARTRKPSEGGRNR
jgi:hypothetical protein